jgi:hypothetical protein
MVGTKLAAAFLIVSGVGMLALAPAYAQHVVWVHDGNDASAHRTRGQATAHANLKAGTKKFYFPVCTFPVADRTEIRRFEIRKALLHAAGIAALADRCNDIVPDATRQAAFVEGYNAVMAPAIAATLGPDWQASIEKKVETQRRQRPKGKLRSGDIDSDTSY